MDDTRWAGCGRELVTLVTSGNPPDLRTNQAGSLGGQSSPVTPSASLTDMQHSSQ